MEQASSPIPDRPVGAGSALLVLAIAFLIPGAGHIVLGHRAKGAGFLLIIIAMFAGGIAMEGRLYELDTSRPLTFGATLASHGSGLLDLTARFAGWSGDGMAPTYEYGTAFILTAGMMNLLLLFDVWSEMRDWSAEESGPSEGITE